MITILSRLTFDTQQTEVQAKPEVKQTETPFSKLIDDMIKYVDENKSKGLENAAKKFKTSGESPNIPQK